jgi:hypothetical protein
MSARQAPFAVPVAGALPPTAPAPSIKIYQTFHKDHVHNAQAEWLRPVGVGGYTHEGFESDAQGDNIAALNPAYCELTVQYWAWKNTRSDYVGLCHYRRLMNFVVDQSWLAAGNSSVAPDQAMVDYLTSPAQLQRLQALLTQYDVVVPRQVRTVPSIEHQYLACVERAPWEAFLRVLRLVYSRHRGVEDYFRLAPQAPMWNMFVMRRDLFEAYCEELFLVLDAVYEQIGVPYDTYQNRYPGFLGERFLGFWLHLNRPRTCEVPMLHLG